VIGHNSSSKGINGRRRCLQVLAAMALPSCSSQSELAHWRLLYQGLEFQLKTRSLDGQEKVYADWQFTSVKYPEARQLDVIGSSQSGEAVHIRRIESQTWSKPSLLLIYDLSTGLLATRELPLISVIETLTGVPGIGIVAAGTLTSPENGSIRRGIFFTTSLDPQAEWQPGFSGGGEANLDARDLMRRLWATGEPGVVVYSFQKNIYRHRLLERKRERIGSGDFASVSHDGRSISFLDAEQNIQLTEFPSMKHRHTFAGPFRDGIVWAPHCTVGLVATPGTVSFGDVLVDSLWLVDAGRLDLRRLGAHRRQVGSSVLRWTGGSEAAIARLTDLAAIAEKYH